MISRLSLSRGVRAALVLAAILLAALAQAWLDQRHATLVAWVFYAVAASLFAVGIKPLHAWRPRLAPPEWPRQKLLLAGVLFCLPAFAGLADNQWRWWSLLFWLMAMLLCFMACRPHGHASQRHWQRLRQSLMLPTWQLRWPTVALILALLVGSALRFYQLHDLPADLGWDLPYNYFDAQRILDGEWLVFFPDNFGREGIFFYLIAAVSRVIGLSPYSIRVTSALVGVATIGAVYGLGRVCYDDEVAAYAAWGLALNRWHLTLSRSGYRVSLMPLFSVLALLTLVRLVRRGRSSDWALVGLVLGLGLMTYKAFTFAVATVVGLAALYLLWTIRCAKQQGAALKGHLIGFGLMLLVLVVTALPMLRFVVDTPELYLARELHGGDLVARSLEREQISALRLYAGNLVTSLGMFNEVGDGNPRFGVPFARHLGYMSGVALILGVALALKSRFRGASGILVGSVLGLMLPMTVSLLAGESPNCFRSSGVIGPSLVLGAAALAAGRRQLRELWAGERLQPVAITVSLSTADGTTSKHLSLSWKPFLVVSLWLAIAATGLSEGVETFQDYFIRFRQVAPDMQNYSVAQELANRMINFGEGPAYLKVWPYWYDGRAVQEHLGAAGRQWDGEYVTLDPSEPPLRDYHGKLLVLMHPQDEQALAQLRQYLRQSAVIVDLYPSGEPALVALYGER